MFALIDKATFFCIPGGVPEEVETLPRLWVAWLCGFLYPYIFGVRGGIYTDAAILGSFLKINSSFCSQFVRNLIRDHYCMLIGA